MKNDLGRPLWHLYLACFLGCIEPQEISVTDIAIAEPEISETSSITGVVSAYKQSELATHTFDKDDKTVISCYVISSDEAGNFYKTLVVQDLAENPSNGLEIKIDLRSYYTKYNFGRKLYINFAGLSMTEVNGKFIVGYQVRDMLEAIPTALLDKFIVRSIETVEIVPQSIDLKDFSGNMINRFIELKDVQFLESDLGKSFASEAYDKFNGERIIEQCNTLAKTYLFTSTYSDFSSYLLPSETFHLLGILSSDYYSGSINLTLNSPEDLTLTNDQRCDPIRFECEDMAEEGGRKVIFYEDFESLKTTTDIGKIGWKNINVNFGNERFRKRSRNENSFVQVSAYDSNEYVMDVWLISPEIDLSGLKEAYFSFDTRATFEEGSVLTVWFSTDFIDDINESSWHQLRGDISIGSRDGSNAVFLNSGSIPIGCIQEKIHVGFRYLGADPGVSTTYDLDNVLVLGSEN
jgi:hypothetical protein